MMFRLVNVPTQKSSLEIKGVVEGQEILVIAAEPNTKVECWRGHASIMTDEFVGDHMLDKPEALRQMFANSLATAIRMARDAGYAQAMADVRNLIGAKANT